MLYINQIDTKIKDLMILFISITNLFINIVKECKYLFNLIKFINISCVFYVIFFLLFSKLYCIVLIVFKNKHELLDFHYFNRATFTLQFPSYFPI